MNYHRRIVTQVSLSSHSMCFYFQVLLLSATSRSPFSNASLLLYATLPSKLLESKGGNRKGQETGRLSFFIALATLLKTQVHNYCSQHRGRSQEHIVIVGENTNKSPFKHKGNHMRPFTDFFFNDFRVNRIYLVFFSPVEMKSKHFSEVMSSENEYMPEKNLKVLILGIWFSLSVYFGFVGFLCVLVWFVVWEFSDYLIYKAN